MNELILELSKRYFVKQLDNNVISVIAHYLYELNDIEETYDSLILEDKYIQTFTIQGNFKYKK